MIYIVMQQIKHVPSTRDFVPMSLFSEYLPPLNDAIGSGAFPSVGTFDGIGYYGTDQTTADGIISTKTWPDQPWNFSWLGPCVKIFENVAPVPCYLDGVDIADIGALAARTSAAENILTTETQDSPSVIEVTAKCQRVLDLECAENDEFVSKLYCEFRKIASLDGADAAIVGQPRFLGRIISHYREILPEEVRPDAFRLRYQCDVGMCWTLAIVETAAILSFRQV